ncbi:MAG: ABC transporter substrate-binding protein, partial [Alphaproteobacteria bacterium]|nr:ABC transporter substrate-binding protein [Alphaproteobacteria bacterium]
PEERVLKVVPFADLQSLDPVVTTVGIVQRHATMVYDVLFGRDVEQNPKPQMVQSWTVSPDGLVWTFVLRDGLMFHDGEAVSADDVVASLRRWAARDANGRQITERTASLVASDAKTIVWRLNRPYGLMLQALSKPSGIVPVIMPKRFAETDPNKAVTEVVGSGPFEFVREEWVPGSKVVYRRNPRYVPRSEPADGTSGGKIAKVDRVEWINIRDAQSAVLALQNGEVDYVEAPGTDFLPLLRQAGMKIVRTDRLGSQGMVRMNHLHAPFDKLEARRALLYLVNQQNFLQTMFSDRELYQPCVAFFVCGSPLESTAGAEPDFGRNKEKARQLMKDAGYTGENIVILHPTDVQTMNVSTLALAEELKSIGVKVDLQAMDFAAMSGRRSNRAAPTQGGWHIGLTFWPGLLISDPIGNVPMQASCEKAWPGWPCDANHQQLIDRFVDLNTPAERKALIDEIQVSAYQKLVPYVPFGQWFAPVAHSPRLSGVIGMPGTMVLWNIEKARR